MLERGEIEPKQAERLRGRMQWFEGYAFGRVAQHSLRILGELSLRRQRSVKLSDVEIRAVEFLAKRVSDAHAVHINPVFLDTFIIFTDGACEGEQEKTGSVGGVLVDPAGRCYQHFSCRVPERFI